MSSTLALFLLVGAAVLLSTWWAFLNEQMSGVTAICSALVAYATFVSTYLLKDREAWKNSIVHWLWRLILVRPRITLFGCTTVALIDVALCIGLYHTLFRPISIPITVIVVDAQKENADTQPFIFSLFVAGQSDPIDQAQSDKPSHTFVLDHNKKNASLMVEISHPGFEPVTERVSAEGSGLTIALKPKPRLVVSINQANMTRLDRSAFEAEAWPAGVQKKAHASFTPDAIFVAASEEDWLVSVTDSRRHQIHYSPAIRIDRARKLYEIDLNDSQTYKWVSESNASPSEPIPTHSPRNALVNTIGTSSANPPQFIPGGLPIRPGHESEKLIIRSRYVVSYNAKLRVPNWVAYRLEAIPEVETKRPRDFVPDPDLPPEQLATKADYRQSGYDRGNLVSGADLSRYGQEARDEAYFLSTIAPQTPVLNQRTWMRLEQAGRKYVDTNHDPIAIIAGTVCVARSHGDETVRYLTIGKNKVAVPSHFFRIHVRQHGAKIEAASFLIPNDSDIAQDFGRYLTSLEKLERVTGLHFFPALGENERPLEITNPKKSWLGSPVAPQIDASQLGFL